MTRGIEDQVRGDRHRIDECQVTGLALDSRKVRPGDLFAALPGTRNDGRQFIDDALSKGAVAVLAPLQTAGTALPEGLPVILDANPHRRLALMASTFFGRQPETVVAVTGTNGKTSVASLARQMWTQLGCQGASLGTLGLVSDRLSVAGNLTTPDPITLHHLLADLANQGVDHLAMEASSHGLAQYRLDGVRLAAAAFTNLSRDHLDYHGDMDAYLAAKSRLFTDLLRPGGTAVLNTDIAEFSQLRDLCLARQLTVSSYGGDGDTLRLLTVTPTPGGLHLDFDLAGGRHQVALPLAGHFQAMNVAAALCLLLATGENADALVRTLPHLHSAPGRMQKVAELANGGAVYVDYAHTPDALEQALSALRPHTSGRLVVVFGCGGDRDAGKRPLMGSVAARLADRALVTDDNPRTEDATKIRAQVMAACPGGIEIADRRAAIAAGLDSLEAGDILLVAGKGHETGQIIGDQVLPFDDAQVVRALLGEGGGA